jgi:hypothetical protein
MSTAKRVIGMAWVQVFDRELMESEERLRDR